MRHAGVAAVGPREDAAGDAVCRANTGREFFCSFSAAGLSDSLSVLTAIQEAKSDEGAESQKSSSSLSPSQPSEMGYLNVASPGDPASLQAQEERPGFCCDDVYGPPARS